EREPATPVRRRASVRGDRPHRTAPRQPVPILDNTFGISNTPPMRTTTGWLALVLATVLWCETPSHAYFLDKGRNFDIRLHSYSQLGIMADSSETDWPGNGLVAGTTKPSCFVNGKRSTKCRYAAGDLAQHR